MFIAISFGYSIRIENHPGIGYAFAIAGENYPALASGLCEAVLVTYNMIVSEKHAEKVVGVAEALGVAD